MLALGARGRGFDSLISPLPSWRNWTARMTSVIRLWVRVPGAMINQKHYCSGRRGHAHTTSNRGVVFESRPECTKIGDVAQWESNRLQIGGPGSNPGIPFSSLSSAGLERGADNATVTGSIPVGSITITCRAVKAIDCRSGWDFPA